MWPAVTSVNTTSAMALPIEATAVRSKASTKMDAATAVNRRPLGILPPVRRPIRGGNCPREASSSLRPVAGYSPALVAPAVANSAVTLIIQKPTWPRAGSAATAMAVAPEAMTSSTGSVPNTPRAMAT